MNSYLIALTVLAAVSSAAASGYLSPAGPLLGAPLAGPALLGPGPLLAPAPILAPHAPILAAPAPILTAPAVVGHAPVVVGHAPVATTTHIGGPIGAHTISRPVATYSTTHTLLGAPLAAPALLARPALPLAAPGLIAPGLAAPWAAPGLLARPALWVIQTSCRLSLLSILSFSVNDDNNNNKRTPRNEKMQIEGASKLTQLTLTLVALSVVMQSVESIITVHIGANRLSSALSRHREIPKCYWDCDLVSCKIQRDDDECTYNCGRVCSVRYDYDDYAVGRSDGSVSGSEQLEPKTAAAAVQPASAEKNESVGAGISVRLHLPRNASARNFAIWERCSPDADTGRLIEKPFNL